MCVCGIPGIPCNHQMNKENTFFFTQLTHQFVVATITLKSGSLVISSIQKKP